MKGKGKNKVGYWDNKPFTRDEARTAILKGRTVADIADILIDCQCKESKEALLRKPVWKLVNMVVDCIMDDYLTLEDLKRC